MELVKSASCTRKMSRMRGRGRFSCEDAIRVGANGFGSTGVDPEKLHEVDVAWRSLLTRKGIAFEIAESTQSSSESWRKLCTYYQANK